MQITHYRLIGDEIDEETGIEPMIRLCARCAELFYEPEELHYIAESDDSCDECGRN